MWFGVGVVWGGVVLGDYNTTLVNSRLGWTRLWQLGSERSADFPIHSCIVLSLKLPPGNEIVHHAGHDHDVRFLGVHLIHQGGVLTHPLK